MSKEGLVNQTSPVVLLTIGEISDLLKVPVKTIYYWVYRNEVPYLKVGRHLRFETDKVLEFFREKSEPTHLSKPCFPHALALKSRAYRSSLTISARTIGKSKP
jgi:excisionase family DNA binding protein